MKSYINILKVIIPVIVVGIIIGIMLNKCQRKIANDIKNETSTTEYTEGIIKSSRHYITEEVAKAKKEQEQKETTKQTVPQYQLLFKDIEDINKDDYEITEFDDIKEKLIYGWLGVWINKNDNTKYRHGYCYNDIETNRGIVEEDSYNICIIEEYQYESYLNKKNKINQIGLEQAYKDFTNPCELLFDLCKKDCTYTNRYISDNFYNKYKNKKGILYNFDFDEILSNDRYFDIENTFEEYNTYLSVLLKKGNKLTKVVITPDFTYENFLDDIKIIDIRDLTNENGDPVKLKMDEYNWLNCIERLAFSDDDEVGKSQRFIEEHPDFSGLFPNDLKVRNVKDIKVAYTVDFFDAIYEKKHLICWVNNKALYKSQKYVIDFDYDGNKYIDKVKIESINEILDKVNNNDIGDNLINDVVITFLIDKERTWDNLPLSTNFKKKFFPKNGILNENNDILSWNRRVTIKKINEKSKAPIYVIDTNLNKHFYGLTFRIVDNLIDDVEIKKLDITEFPEGDKAFDLF